jgi:hypothetical protein
MESCVHIIDLCNPLPFNSYGTMQTSTSPQQSRCVTSAAGNPLSHQKPPLTPRLQPAASCFPLISYHPCSLAHCTQPAPSVDLLGPEDVDGKLDSADAERKRDKGILPDQRDLEYDEPRSGPMGGCSCGTTDALGWYNGWSHSRCVSLFAFFLSRARWD